MRAVGAQPEAVRATDPRRSEPLTYADTMPEPTPTPASTTVAATAPAPGTRVHVAMSKWGGTPHWEFDTLALGEDDFGTWFGTPIGTSVTRPGASFVTEHEHVVLVPRPQLLGAHPHADWVATFYAGHRIHTYVDITTQSWWDDDVVRAVDLDLDVIRTSDDLVFVDDEDEFAEHQVQLGYPVELIAGAERACALVERAVADRSGPFAGVSESWLDALAARTSSR